MTAIDVEVQVGTAPLVDVDVQVEPPTFTVISVLPTGPRGPAGADGSGLPSGGTVGQVVTNTAPGEGEWDDVPGGGGAVDSVDGQTGVVVLSGIYQPLDSDLTAIAALSTTAFGRALLALADAAAGRTAFGLGTVATHAHSEYEVAGAAAAAQAASQPLDSDLTAIAALTTTAYGRAFLALADAAAGRTALGLGTAATSAAGDFQPVDSDLTAIAALSTTSFGRGLLILADAAALRSAAGLGTAATANTGDFDAAGAAAAAQAASQPLDSDLTAIAALSTTSYGRAFLVLADAAAARTALGLGTAALSATGDFEPAGAVAAHTGDTSDAHDAVAISTTPTFGTSTDVEDVLDVLTTEINVLAYGARGDYDTTQLDTGGTNPQNIIDNDIAFAAAWADAKAARAILYIPAGNYGLTIAAGLATDTDDAGIRVEDLATTMLWFSDPGGTGTCVSQSITDATYWSNPTRKALPCIIVAIDGTNAGTGSVALRIGPAHSGHYEYRIRNFSGTGGANGVTGMTGAIGVLLQNNSAVSTQFTESCIFGPRCSIQNCTNALVADKDGGNKSFGYMQFQYLHFRNNTTGITVTNGAWLYACQAHLQGVTTTAITASGITVSGSDSRFTGNIDFQYEINSGSAVVTLITTGSGTWWKTVGNIDALTGAFALPTNSISSTSVFEHDGPFYDSPLPAGSDGWTAHATFDGGIAGDEMVRTGGSSGVASTFTMFGDFRERYKASVPVRWTESGTVKFGVVSIDSTFAAGRTTVTLAASTLYWMAATPDIGSLRFSFGQPPDFPASFRLTALGAQATDADLDDIAALTPSDDDFIQRKSGVWVSRSMAQLKTDLAIAQADVAGLQTDDSPIFAGLTLTGLLNESQGANTASASTVDLGAVTGNYVLITGTTTITAFGTAPAGTRRLVRFNGAIVLTHNATSLVLPGAANITTVAGDFAEFVSQGSGNWRCTSYQQTTVTGSGAGVRRTSPTLITPVLGVASATSVNFGVSSLNAYEEGSWTPELVGATTAGTGWTYTVNAGYYTLIGRVCFFSCRLVVSAIGSGAAGVVRLTGLPFTVKNQNGASNSLNAGLDALTTAIVGAQGRAEINTTFCQFYIRTAAAVTGTLMAIGDISATTAIFTAGQYVIA